MIRKKRSGISQSFWCVFAFLIYCSNNDLMNPNFQPEISNMMDNFQFQATKVEDISQVVSYYWQNTGVAANINQSCSITSGTAILIINDPNGVERYRKNLNDNGTFATDTGATGVWTIVVNLSDVDGTLNFRVQKRT